MLENFCPSLPPEAGQLPLTFNQIAVIVQGMRISRASRWDLRSSVLQAPGVPPMTFVSVDAAAVSIADVAACPPLPPEAAWLNQGAVSGQRIRDG